MPTKTQTTPKTPKTPTVSNAEAYSVDITLVGSSPHVLNNAIHALYAEEASGGPTVIEHELRPATQSEVDEAHELKATIDRDFPDTDIWFDDEDFEET